MTMKKWPVLCASMCALLVSSLPANVVEVEPQKGRRVPSITWIDDTGRTRSLSDLAGFPVVLLPVYTRCRTACIANAGQLKKTLADSTADQSQFRVLLFSFDATDTPATLAAYRRRENIPLGWSLGTSTQRDIDALVESIGFQAGKAGAEFMHTNLVVFLDPNLRVAKWIYGTDYSSGDVDTGLRVATGRSDWLDRYSQWLYSLAVLGASILCVTLVNYLMQLRKAAA
jgi:protein SCO1/2